MVSGTSPHVSWGSCHGSGGWAGRAARVSMARLASSGHNGSSLPPTEGLGLGINLLGYRQATRKVIVVSREGPCMGQLGRWVVCPGRHNGLSSQLGQHVMSLSSSVIAHQVCCWYTGEANKSRHIIPIGSMVIRRKSGFKALGSSAGAAGWASLG